MEIESKERPNHEIHKLNKRRRMCIFLSIVAFVLVVVTVLVIVTLSFTILKVKRPVTSFSSISLKRFDLDLDIIRFRVSLKNISLNINISVNNPNKVGFSYADSSAYVGYRGNAIAEISIPSGKIGAGKTTIMTLTITLLADRLLSMSSNVYSDIISGTLPLTTCAKFEGKVPVIFTNIHVSSFTSCDFLVSVSNRSIRNQTCLYKTKMFL